MKVRMLTTMAGPSGMAEAGQVVDLPRAEAYALIEARAADQVDDEGAADLQPPARAAAARPATATAPAPETRGARRRG